MADIDYFSDSSQHGSYQYVTMETVVNDFMMSIDPDDYIAGVNRYQVLYQARRGFREFYFDTLQEIKAIELTLSPNMTVVVPPDFVNYVRISVVDANGQLRPLAMNHRQSLATAYLQDHKYELLFDNNGCVLKGTGVRERQDTRRDKEEEFRQFIFETGMDFAYTPNINLAESFPNGSYRIDKSKGIIEFSSRVIGKNVVLEYISDGLYTGCDSLSEEQLRIHKFAEKSLMDFIYYELIKNRRNVPANEKQRALKEYNTAIRITRRRINTIRRDELMQIFKGSTRKVE
jgi:hypothetical protein